MTPEQGARALAAARESRTALVRFTDEHPALDESWGYAAQDVDRAERLGHGEVVVGAKLGLTSRAKQVTMEVDEPIVGFLTDAMDLAAPTPPSVHGLIQPRIEPEIAFVLAAPITGALAREEVAGVVGSVSAALELLDSRYDGYRFRLPDVLADNTSAAGFLVGPHRAPGPLDDLGAAGCRFRVDGTIVAEASGSAILGDPLLALVRLSEHLAARGATLPAGAVVLAGAMTDAVPARSGSAYEVEIDGLGTVTYRA